jgi:hypothetical protein
MDPLAHPARTLVSGTADTIAAGARATPCGVVHAAPARSPRNWQGFHRQACAFGRIVAASQRRPE